jgi:hypothetical protein
VITSGIRLFIASFLALFLELLLIRWVPSQIRVIAYYGNLMLLSSFLGLGCGILLARKAWGLHRWFAPLLLLLVSLVIALEGVQFQQADDEFRFLFTMGLRTTTLPIVVTFSLNALVFVPLGELVGRYFSQIPPLSAYSWDICGAISGTLLFGIFSYHWFSPVLGLVAVMIVFMVYLENRLQFLSTYILFAIALVALITRTETTGIWSPYNLITVKENLPSGSSKPVSEPKNNLKNMLDPPFYIIEVNRDSYMMNGTIDRRRFSEPSSYILALNEQYTIAHLVRPAAKDVLVVGSGGGVDVEAALLSGAKRVDALEIDPAIIRLGRFFNASQSYNDHRVTVFNTDARAFFRRTNQRYDMVVFGFLDSQSLFSQMSNIRLDGYVYTRESFQEAFDLLRDGGLMSVSFFSARHIWLLDRLIAMVRSATGTLPKVYTAPEGQIIILAAKGFDPKTPSELKTYRYIERNPLETPEALDDWPYLYLRGKIIPLDYCVTIGALLLVSLLFTIATSGAERKGIDLHFFFLGAGFLLLETKSITTLSLFFGATWLVSMIVIFGVLLMVLMANLVAMRLKRFSRIIYSPLIVSVLFLYLLPNSTVLDFPLFVRLIYSILIIPLPIFFAGLIFSLSLRDTKDSSFAFGSNLLGAMVGGFVEYMGMITGTKALLLIVICFYLASLLILAGFAPKPSLEVGRTS